MSATNLTKNLKLSQFVASDKPSWLGDVNGDNKKIDDGYGVLAGEISKANDTASSAKSQSDANTQTLTNVNSELEDYGNRITALEAGGGTEQLEQRVNTLGTDVEALQTRADTFDEDITTLKSRVDTIEPKVTANAENITSLQTSNTSILSEIQTLKEINTINGQTIGSNTKLATDAKNKADSSYALAQNANTTANSALNTANALSSKALTFYTSDPSTGTASPLYALISENSMNILPLTITMDSQTDSYSLAASYTLPSTINVISGTGESSAVVGHTKGVNAYDQIYNTYLTVSGNVLNVYIKFPSTSAYNKATFNDIYVPQLVISQ